MSSFDRASAKSRSLPALVVLLAATLLAAGCTIQPVYGPAPNGRAAGPALASIAIDPVNDRVAQVVRNKLISGFGSDGGASPVYRMHLTVSSTATALGIGAAGSSPTNQVAVQVTYLLTRIGSDEVVLKSASRATASYDVLNQGFANVRAKIDAENRAGETAADQIRIRVAAALAARA